MTNGTHIWGIDIGGTKIEAAVLPLDNPGVPILRKRTATEGNQGYSHVLNRIKSLVDDLSEKIGERPERIGVGCPGTLDPDTGLLRGSNSTHLNGRALNKDLQNLLQVNIRMENDANCFALAETRLGAVKQFAPNANVVFGIILGTGVGGSLVVNGELISGKHGIGGEWGHNFLDQSGGHCYCGRTGCVETVISGPGLEKFYHRDSGLSCKLEEINELAIREDPHALKTINRLTTFFGQSVAQVINIIDPDIIVVGGGVGNIEQIYTDGVNEIRKHIFAPSLNAQIVKPLLGDSAGVFGAALLTK